jgi:hydrogenase nickel insertion protein HypA
MGPGCPVCVTDCPEIDEAIWLARQGVRITSYGDMLRVPGSSRSLADAAGEGGKVDSVYSVLQAVEIAEKHPDEEVVFFASGFETTAVATAAVILSGVPKNFSVLSAHKYIPPAMEIVAEMPESKVEGFLAAGHAAAITGSDVFHPFVERHRLPVVVAGFEPLDVLAALVRLVELVKDRTPAVENMYPRCVTAAGNLAAQEKLWKVFRLHGGRWRGIAQRQPAPLGRVRPPGRPAPLRHQGERALGPGALRAHFPVHLRRHHGWPALAQRLHALPEGLQPGESGGRLHGLHGGHLSHLAHLRRRAGPEGGRLAGPAGGGDTVHEYSLVQALISRVEEEARKRSAVRVVRLSVRVGEMAGVDAELFQTAYDTFRAGTICAETTLALARVAATWACPLCRSPIPRGAILHCTTCGSPARLDDGGDALTLDGIEMEVP